MLKARQAEARIILHLLTSVAVDGYLLLSRHVSVIILVTNGHSQGAGHRFGRATTVAHDDGQEELLLALAVERSEGRQSGRAVQVVLEVEVVAVAILRWDGEVKGRPVLGRVPVHGSEEGRGLVQPHYLNEEEEFEESVGFLKPPTHGVIFNDSKKFKEKIKQYFSKLQTI